MATIEELGKTIESLRQDIKDLAAKSQHEIERLQAVTECQNLMGRIQFFHTANRNSDANELFAQKEPGVRLYWGELGYWEGPDGPKKAAKIFEQMGTEPVGMMALHLITTPVIVVAGDGKTAKGVFVACGLVANKNRETGKPTAMWEWNKYGVDFIKEDGKWKFLRNHVYPLFRVGWDDKWEDQFKEQGAPGMQMPADLAPDHPTDDEFYSPDKLMKYDPVPPEPYETWEEKTGY